MNTLHLTDSELTTLVHAFEMFNDMTNDTLLENTTADLFPTTDKPTVLTNESAKVLREEINEIVNTAVALKTLAGKLGVQLNDLGYST